VIGGRIILIVRERHWGKLKTSDGSAIETFLRFVKDSSAMVLLNREGTFLALIPPEESKSI
jgi:hypothetical protein